MTNTTIPSSPVSSTPLATSLVLWRLFFKVPAEFAMIFVDALDEYALATTCFEDLQPGEEDAAIWTVEVITHTLDSQENLRHMIESLSRLVGIDAPEVTVALIPETNWLEATWKSFPPRFIGRFYVYGSHNTETVPDDQVGIMINAATAFGSGEHETTTGCLMVLDALGNENFQCIRALDMGCGSGILAIATAKIWKKPVLVVDNDPESVRVALLNAEKNHCSDFISGLVSEGFASPEITGLFDVITANILAKPLILMAPDMIRYLSPKGVIILSGLLARQQDEVAQAYEAQGLVMKESLALNDWRTLTFVKN